jgi:hypothetical protein
MQPAPVLWENRGLRRLLGKIILQPAEGELLKSSLPDQRLSGTVTVMRSRVTPSPQRSHPEAPRLHQRGEGSGAHRHGNKKATCIAPGLEPYCWNCSTNGFAPADSAKNSVGETRYKISVVLPFNVTRARPFEPTE